jgi:hypothetical protein
VRLCQPVMKLELIKQELLRLLGDEAARGVTRASFVALCGSFALGCVGATSWCIMHQSAYACLLEVAGWALKWAQQAYVQTLTRPLKLGR